MQDVSYEPQACQVPDLEHKLHASVVFNGRRFTQYVTHRRRFACLLVGVSLATDLRSNHVTEIFVTCGKLICRFEEHKLF
jgi:hypothetical protein